MRVSARVLTRHWCTSRGKYYLFVSMSAGFWYSDDLLHWDFHADPDLLIYDYAPDVRQVGDYLYFSASRKGA